jgi:hypothetical protein
MEIRFQFVNSIALLEYRVVNLMLWSKATIAPKCHNLVYLL